MSIELTQLTKHYGTLRAVDNLSCRLDPGSVTGLVGANGAGKSTTLRMLVGLTRPTSGTATIDGRGYAELPSPARVIGAMTDPNVFHPRRSGRDALRVLARASRIPARRVDELLDLVQLTDAANRLVGGYSTGMRQRLALAAALLGDPATLVLDEPGNGLDPVGVAWLRGMLSRLADEGRTVLVSSHQLAELEQTVDHVLLIDQGRLRADGPLTGLLADHRSASLEDLFLRLIRKEAGS